MSRNVIIDIIAHDKASPVFDRLAGKTSTLAGRMNAAGKTITKTGAAITKSVTLPVVAAAAVSIKAASDFQKSTTLLQTAGGELAKNMGVVSAGLKKVAVDTGTSLDQLGEGMYIVEKAGIRGAAGLKVLRAGAQGAKAEGVDLSTSMKALTSVMMSYHLGAGKAVSVQNMLVAGAGMAKVSMQEYAGSLSTVVPVASAAGIKFQQVAGAIATLTQHGTSADEATQELANTIRNLQAPNNVAVSAMAQLGIKSNDVSRKLGRRGLTGTLQYLERTVAKNTKGGLVYLGTMKRLSSGQDDLTKMTSAMAPHLAAQSKAFLSGQMSAKDYRAAWKELGAEGSAQGSQFMALASKVRGFSDNVKAGTPAQRTMVAQLKAMLGGANGLNTALQLGGENMGFFKKSTASVREEGAKAGRDISTWAKTQATLAVQADQARAKLQVLAVNVGTQLIPIASQALGVLGRWVGAFENLAPSTQHTIVKVALLAAAVGPAVVVIGKLVRVASLLVGAGVRMAGWAAASVVATTRVVQGMRQAEMAEASMATRSYAMGLRLGGVFSTIGRGAAGAGRYVVNAFKTAGVALAGMPAAARTAEGFGGKLAAVGAGAVGAGAALGPLAGAVIGVGTVVALGVGLWQNYRAKQEQARAAAAANKAAIDSLTQGIEQDNFAIGANTRSLMVHTLQSNGALAAARTLGLSYQTVTDAALGNAVAMARVKAMTSAVANLELNQVGQKKQITGSLAKQADAAGLLLNALGAQQGKTAKAMSAARIFASAMAGQGRQTSTAATAADRLSSSLDRLANHGLNAAQADIAFKQAVVGLTAQIDKHNHSIVGNSAAALQNRAALVGALQAAEQHASAMKDAGKSAAQVTIALSGNVRWLEKQAVKAGLSAGQVSKLVRQMGLTPKQIETTLVTKTELAHQKIKDLQAKINAVRQGRVPSIDTDTRAGREKLREMQAALDAMRDKVVNVRIQTHSDGSATATSTTAGGTRTSGSFNAAGGAIHGPGGPKDDKIHAMLSNGEHVLTASDVHKAGGQGAVYRMRGAIQAGALKFAKGGAITHKGKSWIYAGTSYDTRRAAENARRGAYLGKITTSTQAVGTPYSPPFDASQTSIGRVRGQLGTARHQITADLKSGFITKKDAAEARARLNALQKYARAAFGNLVKSAGSSAKSALRGTVDEARAAFAALNTAATKAGASKAQLAAMARQQATIVGKMQARDRIAAQLGTKASAPTAYDNLAAAKQTYTDKRTGFAGATSAYDATSVSSVFNDQAPGAADAVKSVQAAAAKAVQFGSVMRKLVAEGLPQDLVEQLATAGPSALPQAIAFSKVTKKQLADIKSGYSTLQSAGNSVGKLVADKYYKSGVDSAQGIVDGLLSQQSTLNKAITSIADSMVATLRRKLHIHSPSKVMHELGAFTMEGYVNGYRSQTQKLEDEAHRVTRAARPGAPGPAGPLGALSAARDGRIADHLTIIEAQDARKTAREIQRIQRQRAAV